MVININFLSIARLFVAKLVTAHWSMLVTAYWSMGSLMMNVQI